MAPCPQCGGSGRVHADPAQFNQGNSVVCPKCKGSGQVVKADTSKSKD